MAGSSSKASSSKAASQEKKTPIVVHGNHGQAKATEGGYKAARSWWEEFVRDRNARPTTDERQKRPLYEDFASFLCNVEGKTTRESLRAVTINKYLRESMQEQKRSLEKEGVALSETFWRCINQNAKHSDEWGCVVGKQASLCCQ